MYRDELRVSDFTDGYDSGQSVRKHASKLDYRRSWRSAPAKEAVWWKDLDPSVADPYAWFLRETMRNRHVRAGSRDYVADNGHSYTRVSSLLQSNNTPLTFSYGSSLASKASGYWLSFSPSGGILGQSSLASLVAVSPLDNGGLQAFAQQAVARRAPSPYVFEMSQFLGELREGLPRMVGAALLKGRVKDIMKNAGSEYLNVQFGWAPLVSDLRNLCKVLLDTDALLSNKLRNVGRPVRSTFSVPAVQVASSPTYSWETSLVTWGHPWLYLDPRGVSRDALIAYRSLDHPSQSWVGSGGLSSVAFKGSVIATATRERRFVGSFTSYYDYPPPDASWREKALSLLNLELTPEVLWELAPWSWLVDWLFHIQTTIESNSVASDKSIVMNYGYATELISQRTLVHGVARYRFGGNVTSTGGDISQFSELIKFTRLRANPFGFTATTPQALNPSQVAILAALGLSR